MFIRVLDGDASKLLVIRNPKNLTEAYSFCLELQNVTFRGGLTPTYTNTFANPSQQYRPRFAGFQQPARAPMVAGYSGNPARSQKTFQRFQGPHPAIKQETNISGQSYQSGFSARREEDLAGKRVSNAVMNPFRKAQRLYHMTTCVPPATPVPNEHTQAIVAADPNYEAICGDNGVVL